MSLEFDSITKKKLLSELISRQIKSAHIEKKLQYRDLCRIIKYINTSIFDENKCCLWSGYVTNLKNVSKGTYINFYFRNKKVALHRLLYINYVNSMTDDEYLKYSCENKGKCCNVNHMIKYKYTNTDTNEYKSEIKHEETNTKKSSKKTKEENNNGNYIDPKLFIITFD